MKVARLDWKLNQDDSEVDEFESGMRFFSFADTMHCVEAALLDGADPDEFLFNMIQDLKCSDFTELANICAGQDYD